MRREILAEGEYYHIFNRGTDKRRIFNGFKDMKRFREEMDKFNAVKARGGIHVDRLHKHKLNTQGSKLVEIVAFCLLPNHFHILLKQVEENGISKYISKVCGGYSCYFNISNDRSGTLFQGRFKAVHIESNEQLLKVASYVNLNNRVHKIPDGGTFMSSWREYTKGDGTNLCGKDIIVGQFKSLEDFINFSEESVSQTIERRLEDEEEKDKT